MNTEDSCLTLRIHKLIILFASESLKRALSSPKPVGNMFP